MGGYYIDLGVATAASDTIWLTDTAHGRVQRELPERPTMRQRESLTEGSGLHGASQYRLTYSPFTQPVDVDIVGNYGANDDEMIRSYQRNLQRAYAQFAGQQTLVGRYGDEKIVKAAAICQVPWPVVAEIPYGNRHRINFTVTEFIRSQDAVEPEPWTSLTDPQVLLIPEFDCSAPMVRTFWTITGPSDPLIIESLNPAAGVPVYGSLIYDKALASGEILTIDTDYRADPILTSSVPANLDYRALSHPNNPNLLEIIPGWSGGLADDVTRVRITGGPAEVSVSSVLAWLGF